MITAQSADGVLHQFPDGTADDIVDRAMQDYVAQSAPAAAPSGPTFDTAADSAARGLPPLPASEGVARTGYRAQVARTMSGQAVHTPAKVPTPAELGQEWADVGGGMPTGWLGGIPGQFGDAESLLRLIPSKISPISPDTIIPTTGQWGDKIAGPPANSNVAMGRELGSLLSPLTLLKVLGVAGKIGAKALPAGRTADELARGTIDKFAGGAPSLDTRQIVPGSEPTMAEASTDDNLGIASLQRTVRDLVPNSQIAQRETANAKARSDFFGQLAGTPGDLESAKLARDAATDPMRTAAFANAGAADSSSVDRTIGRILSGPAGQRDAVANVLQDIRAKLQVDNPLSARISDAMGPIQDELGKAGISQARRVDLMEARRLLGSASRGYTAEDELTSALNKLAAKQKIVGPIDNALSVIKSGDTAFESNPEQLYGIRQSITDRLSPLARGTANDARVAASKLQPVMQALDEAIQSAAPGYKEYMAKFSELSKPIDQMDYLQSLNLVDQRGNITLAKVQNALRNISEQRKAGGINQAKSLTDDHIQQLESLRDDLIAGNNITLGKAVGSNTVQNIASQRALQSVLPGKVGAFAGRYVRPEVAGGAIGGILGSIFGPGGAVAGAGIGTGIGNVVSHGMQAKNAEVLARLEAMLVDPRLYANKAPIAGAGKASVARLPAINTKLLGMMSPQIVAQLLLQSQNAGP